MPRHLWSDSFVIKGGLVCFVFYHVLQSPVLKVSSVDPDQTPRSAASNLGLQCLPVPFDVTSDINRLTTYYSYRKI